MFWPCMCFCVCSFPSSFLSARLPCSVCQLLLISAREVASALSSDKALTSGVKECEPRGCDDQDLPLGADNAEHLSKRPNDLTRLCDPHTFFLRPNQIVTINK